MLTGPNCWLSSAAADDADNVPSPPPFRSTLNPRHISKLIYQPLSLITCSHISPDLCRREANPYLLRRDPLISEMFFVDALTQNDIICAANADNAFGPAISQSCRAFDFTLMFEQSILSVPPSALFMLLVPWSLQSSLNASRKTLPCRWRLGFTLGAATVLAIIQLTLLVIWSLNDRVCTAASVPAATLSFVGTAVMMPLIYIKHTRSIRPSTLIVLYLLLSSFLDIPQARTLYLRHDGISIPLLFTLSIFARLILLPQLSRNKAKYLKEPYNNYPPEATSGVITRSFLWWLMPLFFNGFRRLILMDDLFSIDPSMSSEMLRDSMQIAWNRRSKPETRFSLPLASATCLLWPLIYTVPPRLCLIGFTYAQPFLISTTISYISEPSSSSDKNYGLGLIAATALVYGGIAISTVCYEQRLYRSITMLRGALVGLIYNKTLVTPDGVFNEVAAITLMSTDIDRITVSMQVIHEVWSRIIEVAIGIGLLERQLGAVCVVPIIIVTVCGYGNIRAANLLSSKQKIWNAAIQRRIAMTSSMLGSMKAVKMLGLSDFMSKSIQGQRIRELDLSKGFRWLNMLINTNSNTPIVFAPVLTFVTFAIQAKLSGSASLSTNTAFTSLSIIALLTTPAAQLLNAIPKSAACLGCFERIQKFLLSPEWEDQRLLLNPKYSFPLTNSGSTSSQDTEMEDVPYRTKNETSETGTYHCGNELYPMAHSISPPQPTILIEKATIRPSSKSEAVLHNVTLKLGVGVNMITGPVGSGKTTLMRAILGEVPNSSGKIEISTRDIAYCSQTPWLLNTTVQQIVCGLENRDFDEKWYNAVIYGCALDQDLQQFPHGDQSIIGSGGLTLSGGQKQRVALARAVYARKKVILLDDIFSALDGKTEQLITDRLFGSQGLLRKPDTTIVLATHSTRHFRLADHIVILTSDGSIAYQGSFSDLKSKDDYIRNTLLGTQTDSNVIQPVHDTHKQQPRLRGVAQVVVGDSTRKTGDIAVYRYYFRSIGWLAILGFMTSSAVYAFAQFFPQIWLEWWTEANGGEIGKFISVYIVLGVGATIFRALSLWWVLIYISPRSSAILHYTLLKTTINAPQSYFTETDTGETLNRFSQDISLIDRNLCISFGVVVIQLFSCLAQVALISQGSSYMAATIPLALVAIFVLQKVYLRTSRQLRLIDLEARSPVYSHFLETIDGLSTIRAFGWQDSSLSTNIRYMDTSQKPSYLLYCIQRWLNLVLDLILTVIAVIVITLAVEFRSTTSGAAIGIALNNILGFNQTLSSLVDYYTQLETSLGSISRLKNFEATVISEHRPGEIGKPSADWPAQGTIEFRNITASYGNSTPVLRNISLSIKAGQKVGICGRTGSGKSSLLLTLLRLLELQSGTIVVDGIDFQTLPREVIRSRMITIPQDPFILNETVRANVDPLNVATDEKIIAALSKVQLWTAIHARGGLDAQMKIQPLSQGQQQLFCLARAMLRHGKILLLDEATSSVDADTDRLMQDLIREEFSQHTIITIAHRLNTIMDSDVVVVLDEGRVAEFDSPEELLGRHGSLFREMHRG